MNTSSAAIGDVTSPFEYFNLHNNPLMGRPGLGSRNIVAQQSSQVSGFSWHGKSPPTNTHNVVNLALPPILLALREPSNAHAHVPSLWVPEAQREREKEMEKEREKESKRERKREREGERVSERGRERKRGRKREREKKREKEREGETEREKERERERERERRRELFGEHLLHPTLCIKSFGA